jgi:hypothetical protein
VARGPHIHEPYHLFIVLSLRRPHSTISIHSTLLFLLSLFSRRSALSSCALGYCWLLVIQLDFSLCILRCRHWPSHLVLTYGYGFTFRTSSTPIDVSNWVPPTLIFIPQIVGNEARVQPRSLTHVDFICFLFFSSVRYHLFQYCVTYALVSCTRIHYNYHGLC